jgi:lysophospholipase L1-like esterase
MVVDMYTAFSANPNFSTSPLSDGLHPSSAGYAIMANVRHAAIGPLLR